MSEQPPEPRLIPLPVEKWDPRLREGLARAEETAAEGEGARNLQVPPNLAINLIRTLAWNPDLTIALEPLLTQINSGSLPHRDRELAILRTAVLGRSGYEWSHHHMLAQLAGFTEDEVVRAGLGASSGGWSEDDAALLTAVDELHDQATLTDATWAKLAGRYDEAQLLELLVLVGTYRALAGMLNACRVPLDDWQTPRPLPGEDSQEG
ncbi:carboxymuconolactone decarboxylase family protein [Streptomyces sp. B1866]|uniref:carboxymuconolactone decarboxylase family protein n=1 Tax=Streptomyces sp. B1866 TaxID=3075431 RepID=UPI002891E7C6|nr:carboxymuconolactone decarboxylase family protein [Streptomyces sp. B1866]MDT3398334.1 carboxymuconolactone decarboxylase family protein [Streptomyces sp. B1866]